VSSAKILPLLLVYLAASHKHIIGAKGVPKQIPVVYYALLLYMKMCMTLNWTSYCPLAVFPPIAFDVTDMNLSMSLLSLSDHNDPILQVKYYDLLHNKPQLN